jgi:hypothetical protein
VRAFAENWSAKVEYLYVNLGSGTVTCALTPQCTSFLATGIVQFQRQPAAKDLNSGIDHANSNINRHDNSSDFAAGAESFLRHNPGPHDIKLSKKL